MPKIPPVLATTAMSPLCQMMSQMRPTGVYPGLPRFNGPQYSSKDIQRGQSVFIIH